MSLKNNIAFAFIGCGAVVEQLYMPAIKKLRRKPAFLIDPNLSRAELMARRFGAKVSANFEEVIDDFDAAIVSVPNYLHAPITIALLKAGKHVLVEKPMALTLKECRKMIETAEQSKRILSVGLFRCFLRGAQWVKLFIDSGKLGEIKAFEFREGGVYSWPVTTDSFWKREKAGGGVLIDTGSHTLDQLIWWLGDVNVIEYRDDSFGGVEADCYLRLKLSSGAEGTVELSRTRDIGAEAVIRGTKGSLKVGLLDNKILSDPQEFVYETFNGIAGTNISMQSYVSLFTEQLKNWFLAISSGNGHFVDGVQASKSIAIIDTCYQNRKQWSLPWVYTEDDE